MLAVEADCYWCLCKLIEGIQDHYTYSQPGIQRTVFKVKELVRWVGGQVGVSRRGGKGGGRWRGRLEKCDVCATGIQWGPQGPQLCCVCAPPRPTTMLRMRPSKPQNYAAHVPLQGPQLCRTCAPPRPTTMLHMCPSKAHNYAAHVTNE